MSESEIENKVKRGENTRTHTHTHTITHLAGGDELEAITGFNHSTMHKTVIKLQPPRHIKFILGLFCQIKLFYTLRTTMGRET